MQKSQKFRNQRNILHVQYLVLRLYLQGLYSSAAQIFSFSVKIISRYYCSCTFIIFFKVFFINMLCHVIVFIDNDKIGRNIMHLLAVTIMSLPIWERHIVFPLVVCLSVHLSVFLSICLSQMCLLNNSEIL